MTQTEDLEVKLKSASATLHELASELQFASELRNEKLEEISSLNATYSECSFEYRSLSNKINDLSDNIHQIYQSFIRLDAQKEELNEQVNRELEGEQSVELQTHLAQRIETEEKLNAAREVLSGWDQQLRSA